MSAPTVSPTRAIHPAAAWLARSAAPNAQLSADSRAIGTGDVFIAMKGAHHDARRFIPDAIAQGAAAVVWDATAFAWRPEWNIPNRPERELKNSCGVIAADWYRRPADRLWSVGITGTSGKSSSALWLAQAFTALGRRAAVVGTLGIGFAEQLEDSGMTTPDAITLQRHLRALVDAGADMLAMEVSSIGLAEGRVAGMRFDGALFTNLSRDHFDYHGDMQRYEAAKAKLFAWPGLAHAIVNVDDAAGVRIAAAVQAAGVALIRFSAAGTAEAELRARSVAVRAEGLAFEVFGAFGVRHIRTPFIGSYNVANLLGVLGVLLASGIAIDAALAALAALQPVPGRLQRVAIESDEAAPLVLVDYAHKPDALEKVLAACRPLADARDGRIVVVFGCGGDRDAGKRPIMGEIAARLADAVIVTSDNPRSEEPLAIIDQILAGVVKESLVQQSLEAPARVTAEPDRRAAIHAAIASASARDVVVIAGKGHESTQEIAGVRQDFSDADVATEALRDRHAAYEQTRERASC